MALFRVWFDEQSSAERPRSGSEVRRAGGLAGAQWEGSSGAPDGRKRHRILIERESAETAVGDLQGALGQALPGVVVDRLSPPRGWQGQGWHEAPIDWETVGGWCRLTELQHRLLETLLDDAEPFWMVLREARGDVDRGVVEGALADLEGRGLVWRSREPSGSPDDPAGDDDWWALTDQAWSEFGLIKSPAYNGGRLPGAHARAH